MSLETVEELFGPANWPAVQQHAIHNPLLASALKIIEQLAAEVVRLRDQQKSEANNDR